MADGVGFTGGATISQRLLKDQNFQSATSGVGERLLRRPLNSYLYTSRYWLILW
jgi:hypothetical protein